VKLGPLEYVVIAFDGDRFDGTILGAIRAAHEREIVRLVDLLFVRKDASGVASVTELSDLADDEADALGGFARDMLMTRLSDLADEATGGSGPDFYGLLTAEDVEKAARDLPPATAAAVALLEHTWAIGLQEAIARAGGRLLAGGLVDGETLRLLNAELAAGRAAA